MVISLFFIILLLGIVLLAGCSGTRQPREPIESHHGTEGLVMEFMRGQPPNRVYNRDQMDVTVELRNRGAWPTQESGEAFAGTIFIGGYDPAYIPLSPTYYILDGHEFYGKDQYSIEGSYGTRTFSASSVNIPPDVDRYNPWIQITACYDYKTVASANICIDPDPWKAGLEDEVCDVQDVSLGSQGAPISVNSVDVDVTSHDIKFRIEFSNAATGYPYDWTQRNDCPDIEYVNLDKVDVEQVILSGAHIEATCTPPNPIKMYNNRGFVVCSVPKPHDDTPAYMTPLQIVLKYGYTDSIRMPIEVMQT